MNPRLVAVLMVFALAGAAPAPRPAASAFAPIRQTADYHSPDTVTFTYPLSDLIGDILRGERGTPQTESSWAPGQWSSPAVRRRYGAWGPPSRALAPPPGLADKPAEWKRERVLAIALRSVGRSYQHHHLPDWNPPAGWPWLPVGRGRNEPGVDCSNFTSFVYNLALGVKLSGAIGAQAAQTVRTVNGRAFSIQRLEKPAAYADCRRLLRPGDLLYIRNRAGDVSHVVIWVGALGHAPDGVPLVLDSTGAGHRDSLGHVIPDGVQLRPFRSDGWYFGSLSHIHRLIPDDRPSGR